MSLASVAAQQNAAGTTTSAAASGGSPTLGLASNFHDFLKLLTTQLQHQDPSSPMDSNQFTTELVQFSSVEQQINTNTALSQLIALTQAGEIMQSSSMVGRSVSVDATDLSLQKGQAEVNFTVAGAQPVQVSVSTDSGIKLLDTSITATPGANTWKWDGMAANGNQQKDGTYKVTITGQDAAGKPVAIPFTVTGTATGVQSQGKAVQLQVGALSVPFSSVKSVNN